MAEESRLTIRHGGYLVGSIKVDEIWLVPAFFIIDGFVDTPSPTNLQFSQIVGVFTHALDNLLAV